MTDKARPTCPSSIYQTISLVQFLHLFLCNFTKSKVNKWNNKKSINTIVAHWKKGNHAKHSRTLSLKNIYRHLHLSSEPRARAGTARRPGCPGGCRLAATPAGSTGSLWLGGKKVQYFWFLSKCLVLVCFKQEKTTTWGPQCQNVFVRVNVRWWFPNFEVKYEIYQSADMTL